MYRMARRRSNYHKFHLFSIFSTSLSDTSLDIAINVTSKFHRFCPDITSMHEYNITLSSFYVLCCDIICD